MTGRRVRPSQIGYFSSPSPCPDGTILLQSIEHWRSLMKKVLAVIKWGVIVVAALFVVVWVDYVLTKVRLTNDQDECAAIAHKAVPTTNVDDAVLRRAFAECMAPRNWSERLMFGDWPLGRHAWKE